jgi:hypothetical protein
MLTGILVTLLIVGSFAYAQRSGKPGGAIVRHPYNNIHSDATGVRDEALL